MRETEEAKKDAICATVSAFLEWVKLCRLSDRLLATFLFLSTVVAHLKASCKNTAAKYSKAHSRPQLLPAINHRSAYNEERSPWRTPCASLLTLEHTAPMDRRGGDGSKDHLEGDQTLICPCSPASPISCQRESSMYARRVPVTLIEKRNTAARTINCQQASLLRGRGLRSASATLCAPSPADVKTAVYWRLAASSASPNDVELENRRVKRYRLPRSILALHAQVLEYDRSFLVRILFDRFNRSLIISGIFKAVQRTRSSP